jgi:hypothetical protein
MKYNVEKFARKKGLDLNQIINHGTNYSSLQELLEEYADRYCKHKKTFEEKGNETKCME